MGHAVRSYVKNSKAIIPSKLSTSLCLWQWVKLFRINSISQQEDMLRGKSALNQFIANPLCNNPNQGSSSISRPFQPFRKPDQQAITQYSQLDCLLWPEIRYHKNKRATLPPCEQ